MVWYVGSTSPLGASHRSESSTARRAGSRGIQRNRRAPNATVRLCATATSGRRTTCVGWCRTRPGACGNAIRRCADLGQAHWRWTAERRGR
jgi:hypothetical protein